MQQLGLEYLSVFGMPPVEFVTLAADLGCNFVTLVRTPANAEVGGYPPFSFRDAGLRRELKAALHDRGIAAPIADGFFIIPGQDIRSFEEELDLLCDLGARSVNTVALEPDLQRCIDQTSTLCEMAAQRDLIATVEFVPGTPIYDVPTALALLNAVDRTNLKLVIDVMHLTRSGGTAADLAQLDPSLLALVQICDCPLSRTDMSYAEEAIYERMTPGEGELPLANVLRALPNDLPMSIEVPQRSLALAGVSAQERLARCVEATRRLLQVRDASTDREV